MMLTVTHGERLRTESYNIKPLIRLHLWKWIKRSEAVSLTLNRMKSDIFSGAVIKVISVGKLFTGQHHDKVR